MRLGPVHIYQLTPCDFLVAYVTDDPYPVGGLWPLEWTNTKKRAEALARIYAKREHTSWEWSREMCPVSLNEIMWNTSFTENPHFSCEGIPRETMAVFFKRCEAAAKGEEVKRPAYPPSAEHSGTPTIN
jgi:hypothetical protein